MGRCKLCGRTSEVISEVLGFCADCIRDRFSEVKPSIDRLRREVRSRFGLPPSPPKKGKVLCDLCGNMCSGEENDIGFCGKPIAERESKKALLLYYYDPIPTNCVSAWCCSKRSHFGKLNLAVFYQRCNFDCLFCQNWDFRDRSTHRVCTVDELTSAVNEKVACICFFGGDPTPFFLHSLEVAERILSVRPDVSICWETNGSVKSDLMIRALEIAAKSRGTVKFDLKFYSEELSLAICGASNKTALKNFEIAAEFAKKHPGVAVASTLLVPGYTDVKELELLANFISSVNENVPWSILAFYPTFVLKDLPTTSFSHAEAALKIAERHGIKKVHLGNKHLLSESYFVPLT